MVYPRRNAKRRSIAACWPLIALYLSLPLVPSAADAQPKRRTRSVAFANVILEFDAALANDYVAEAIPAVPLEDTTDKPDGVAPAHVLITLRDSYASRLKRDTGSSYALPQIAVYPTRDPSDPRFDREYPTLRDAVAGLGKLLSRRAGSVTEAIPFLPWADEHQLFIGRKRLIRFRNGRGVLFLTQYDQEESPVSNSFLVYTFQGMTDDNAWYVSALFPVSAQGLAAPQEKEGSAAFHAGYASYLRATTEKLNRLPAKRFTPGLLLLEEMIRSLKVGPR